MAFIVRSKVALIFFFFFWRCGIEAQKNNFKATCEKNLLGTLLPAAPLKVCKQ